MPATPFHRIASPELSAQDLLNERKCSRVLALTEPKHRLFSDFRIAVGLRHLDEKRNAVAMRNLAQREYGFLLDLGFRIVLDRVLDGGGSLLPGFLCEPKERLASNMSALVIMCDLDHGVDCAGLFAFRHRKNRVLADFVAGVVVQYPQQRLVSMAAASAAHPEHRVPPETLRLILRRKLIESCVRRGIVVQCDRRDDAAVL